MVNTISFRARLILLPERLNEQYGVDGLRIRYVPLGPSDFQ